jgi:hypothetical protein
LSLVSDLMYETTSSSFVRQNNDNVYIPECKHFFMRDGFLRDGLTGAGTEWQTAGFGIVEDKHRKMSKIDIHSSG